MKRTHSCRRPSQQSRHLARVSRNQLTGVLYCSYPTGLEDQLLNHQMVQFLMAQFPAHVKKGKMSDQKRVLSTCSQLQRTIRSRLFESWLQHLERCCFAS